MITQSNITLRRTTSRIIPLWSEIGRSEQLSELEETK